MASRIVVALRRAPAARRHVARSAMWSRHLSGYPTHSVVGLPSLSPTMESGTLARWNVSDGSKFVTGDVIAEIETDKATVDFEAQDDGIVAKLLVPEGSEVTVGTPIMVVVEDAADVSKFADFTPQQEATAGSSAPPSPTPPPPEPAKAASFLMPGARFLAESKKIDVSSLAGTGKGGRITKGDVLSALASGKKFPNLVAQPPPTPEVPPPPEVRPDPVVQQPSQPEVTQHSSYYASGFPKFTPPVEAFDPSTVPTTGAPYDDTPASSMRKVIAKRLAESRSTVPHSFVSIAVELDQIAKLRKQLVTQFDIKVSVNDFVIRACALALRDVPKANSSWIDGDAVPNTSIDVSVAVATPSGLITPIVTNAAGKGLAQISAEVRDLATRARSGKLAPHEFQGGTFTVSNLGMFGIKEFSAVINPPQACILAVGTGIPTLKPTSDAPRKATVMTSRLSHDRRVVDEPIASLFLSTYAYYIANPNLLVL